MNVFQKYTRASLRKNRTRTLVTVLGILLSMALFTAVIEGAYSGLQFMIRVVGEREGYYHLVYPELREEELADLRAQDGIDETTVWQAVGWAPVKTAEGGKPYLLVQDIGAPERGLSAVQLEDGRLPENENELVLPLSFSDDGGTLYRIGDEITLEVGLRTFGGRQLGIYYDYNPDETLTETVTRTYTVVGHLSYASANVEPYVCPGYTALTLGGGRGTRTCYLTMDNPRAAFDFLETHRYSNGGEANSTLLGLYGSFSLRNLGVAELLYGFAGVLVGLILFGSVSLIYNSFSISVAERTRQFGILKSIGATKKQIRGAVLYEALLLSAVSIPLGLLLGCGGIGLALYLLRDAFALLNNGTGVQMTLVLSPGALGLSALIALLTTLISAWVPAQRAVRVTPIQAIRQSEDVKLSSRDVRTLGVTKTVFGFEGMMASKNFRRNRRRYRATVVSLFLSVVLFIAAASFSDYLRSSVQTTLGDRVADFDLTYSNYELVDPAEVEDALQTLLTADQVTDGTYLMQTALLATFDDGVLDPDYPTEARYAATEEETLQEGAPIAVYFLRDAEFRQLLRDNGLDEAAFFDPEHPQALVRTRISIERMEDGTRRWTEGEALDEGALPITCTVEVTRSRIERDGKVYLSYDLDEDGAWFWTEEDYLEDWEAGREPDKSKAILLPNEEFYVRQTLTLGAAVDGDLWFGVRLPDYMAVIYPYSMYDTAVPAFQGSGGVEFFFRTADHAAAYASMQELASERYPGGSLYDGAENMEQTRMILTVVDVFSYGFILIISLIAAANVFNTISTSIGLRRRELAMLQSIGLGRRSFYRMMNLECLIYGYKALLWGLPAAFGVTFLIWRMVSGTVTRDFYVPWYSVVIAVGSVFLVVFATMLYATRKLRRENPIDALKLENL